MQWGICDLLSRERVLHSSLTPPGLSFSLPQHEGTQPYLWSRVSEQEIPEQDFRNGYSNLGQSSRLQSVHWWVSRSIFCCLFVYCCLSSLSVLWLLLLVASVRACHAQSGCSLHLLHLVQNLQHSRPDTRSATSVAEAIASGPPFSPVSSFISLRRPQALANCHITHILSVIDWHFDDNSRLIKGYKHLHIPVHDVDDENLITWFPTANRFIDDGLNSPCQADKDVAAESGQDMPDQNGGRGGVLVHW